MTESLYCSRYWLYHNYVILHRSSTQMAIDAHCSPSCILSHLRDFSIPVRSRSESLSGVYNPFYGKKHSPEILEHNRDWQLKNSPRRGKHCTPEHRARIGAANRGKTPFSKGLHLSESHKLAIGAGNKGKKRSFDVNLARSVSTKGRIMLNMTGPNHPNWKGGLSFEPYCPMWTKELKERIRAFFEYRCICCGKHQTELKRKLNCHHVEYNKKACCDGKPVHFAAMCDNHHSMTNMNRERWEHMIHRIIDEIYDGKSYYTKEEYENVVMFHE